MPPVGGGFSWDQVIQFANRRTEQRGTSLDLDGELFTAIQEVCLEQRWWWRRRISLFNLVAGQALYDLTATSAGAINAPDLQQIAKNGFKIYTPGTSCYGCPDPVFDVDQQDNILATQSLYPPAMPCRFFILAGQTSTLIVDPVPDQNYSCALGYWAIPNYTDDDQDLSIPLLPVWMQPVLIKKLEAQIERYSQSEEGPQKYEMVMSEYQRLLEKASLYRQFADGLVEDLRVRSHTDSVQSTS
jgi:hypothetical protein